MAEDASNPEGQATIAPNIVPPPLPKILNTQSDNELRPSQHPPHESANSHPATQPDVPESSTKPPESQPMTATVSSSSTSNEPPTTTATNHTTEGVSPYGTRSRQRAGQARPNYAEADAGEPDLDLEFDVPVKKSRLSSNSPSTGLFLSSAVEGAKTGSGTRRSSATFPVSSNAATTKTSTAQSSHSTNAGAFTGSIPGTSSFSVHPQTTGTPPATSRKRKQPGSAVTASQSTTVPTSTPVVGSSRRQGATVSHQVQRTTNLMSFEKTNACLKGGKLKADDGTVLGLDDQFYAVSEPPGDCYYLGRIQAFVHEDNDVAKPVESIKANWFIRPTEVGRKVNDTRVVFASFNSHLSPVSSLRGKCSVIHRSEIADLEAYRKQKDCFYYERLFDRYIHRYFDIIPTSKVNNVPAKVKKALDERWKYVVVEVGRGRDLTSAIKSCKRCADFSSRDDSVDCAVCKNTYHMSCVRPPLLKKPARGFGWSCGPCSRKQERRLEARNTPNQAGDGEEEDFVDEEEEIPADQSRLPNTDQVNGDEAHHREQPTADQKELWDIWPYRYLGIHCRVEDALDYDDRIYPRASSRLGPKHQAIVHVWHGRPVCYVKAAEMKRKYIKGGNLKNQIKVPKETTAASEAEKAVRDQRPKWVLDAPPGYLDRGEDHANGDAKNTARVIFRLPEANGDSSRGLEDASGDTDVFEREQLVEDYMSKAKSLARVVGVQEYSTNFLDKALELLVSNNYQSAKALEQLQHVKKRKDLKEPELNREELKRFEEGVAKWGSMLQYISRHVGKGQKHGEIVRFYYMWKKTKNGREIWGNFDGRKAKKQAKSNQSDPKLLDDVADDDDDSAFDNAKAQMRRRGFECKFCQTRQSPQWHRAPNVQPGTTVPADPSLKSTKDRSNQLMLALCQRCTGLWRKYAIAWENIDEVAKKVQSTGGRAWKRKQDQELLSELLSANQANQITLSTTAAAAAASIGIDVPPNLTHQSGPDGSKKKQKIAMEQQSLLEPQNGLPVEPVKKKEVEKVVEPPIVPDPPRVRLLPCAVCYEFEPMSQHLCCNRCRLTVHRDCYGVPENTVSEKWTCDMCTNDTINTVSTTYECILCTVNSNTDTDVALLMEPPKVSHKKKSDREREKERLEKEMIDEKANEYFREQEAKGRPKTPRQPLKRTSGNNWVHVVCATFHPEIKYSSPELLEFAENVGDIPGARWSQKCKHCKIPHGACVNCQQCQAPVHVGCAQQFGYHLVFDLSPVKQSRKDAVNTVGMGGEFGSAAAVIYCREHGPKQKVHRLCEIDEGSNINALQKYVRSHKRADTSLTGTTRKALMMLSATRTASQLAGPGGTRATAAAAGNSGAGNSTGSAAGRGSRSSPSTVIVQSEETDEAGDRVVHLSNVSATEPIRKRCDNCNIDASPKWHEMSPQIDPQALTAEPIKLSSSDSTIARPMTSSSFDKRVGSSHAHPTLHQSPPRTGLGDAKARTDGSDLHQDRPATLSPGASRHPIKTEDGSGHDQPASKGKSRYLCNKCHCRKRKERTATPLPREPSPKVLQQDDPKTQGIQADATEYKHMSPQAPSPWSSKATMVKSGPLPPAPQVIQDSQPAPSLQVSYPPPVVPAQETHHHRSFSGPQEPPYHGPDHVPNGRPPPSPVLAPPSSSSAANYGPPSVPPPPQAPPVSYGPPAYTPFHADTREHGPSYPRQYPGAPPTANGYPSRQTHEPASFQYRRDPDTGQLYQIPYVPRGQSSSSAAAPSLRSPPPVQRLLSPHMRSPQVHHSLPPPSLHHVTPPSRHARLTPPPPPPPPSVPEPGPHGPPEADSNPFIIPYGAHSSPRVTYSGNNMFESPRRHLGRSRTPDQARNRRWPSEPRPMASGASESPNLRNLLH